MMGGYYILEFLEKLTLHRLSFVPLFLSLIFIYTWINKKNYTKNPLPSPPKLPILGNLHQIGKAPHRSLHSLSKKYGELMLLHLGSKPTLVVSSVSAAKEIMKTHDVIFSNRPKLKMQRKLLYNGKDVAFTNYGEYWRQMKRIFVLHLLSNRMVRSYRNIREEETALLVDNIKRSERKEAVNLSKLVITLTNDVTCRIAFGKKYKGKDGSNFTGLLERFLELMGVLSVEDLFPWVGWIDKLNGLEGKANKLAKEVDVLLEGILEEHLDGQRTQVNARKDEGCEKVKDFVDVLIKIQKDDIEGHLIDSESIKAIIMDVFSAGTETTFAVIEWAMSELLSQPQIMNKLQEEVRSFTQGKAAVNEDDLDKMKYLKAVIKETFRLHPPLPLLVYREPSRDVKVIGYEIAAKTQVIINVWGIQRDPSLWEAPEDFFPERFLNSPVDFKGFDFQLIPFGAGRRICPGIQFSIITVELVLANLVNAFDWALPSGAKCETLDMEESSGITCHRRNPLILLASPQCSVNNED